MTKKQEYDLLKKVKIQKTKNIIDRKEENKDVLEYVETGDDKLFEKIYHRRLSTINYLAHQYYWLSEDAASEIKIVFIKTVRGYKKNKRKTDFNTFFYSSVKNHFVNMIKYKYRKKRTTIDDADPLFKTTPLDEFLNEDSNLQRHELVDNNQKNPYDLFSYEVLADFLSKDNQMIKDIILCIKGLDRQEMRKSNIIIDHQFEYRTDDVLFDFYDQLKIPKNSVEMIENQVKGDRVYAKVEVNTQVFMKYMRNKMEKDSIMLEECQRVY